MDITEQQLRALIQGHVIGDFGDVQAYKTGSRTLVDNFIHEVVDDLRTSSRISLEMESENYGSGTASYWDVFCTKKQQTTQKRLREVFRTNGITLYLCRHAPVAVLGASNMIQSQNTKSYGFLCPENVDELPPDKWYWSQLVAEIRTKLKGRGFILPSKEFFEQSLPFETQINTILTTPPYTIFDAFFYWED